ncbi:T9SS type B sorting domain-containing protein [Larkinella rosea]|uniref:Gliding motility-associated C-terminal domain-containing protein n=1 Tax=Larkinella rosea TaxID=2025312 RepID=A0A3P1BUE6_9BACT|nr:gliding motility-associated C-terminal domain-containing protein [Larkinella rosea]RRB04730.1 gliding motility-associated C-terminal domain-containing protein [Larkinella rosea]
MRSRTVRMVCWLVLFLPGMAVSQNLVQNGGFETYRSCPRQDNLLIEATPWYNPNGATPDFYHQCFPTVQMELPPHSGQGLARLFLDVSWAEYLATPLKKPLEAGECYFFEMYVATPTPSKYLNGTIGAYVSEKALNSTEKGLFTADAQVIDNVLTTSIPMLRWEKISGYVKAKGGEQYLTIGSFKKLPVFLGYFYLFVDDVALLPIKTDLGKDTTLCGRKSTLLLDATTPGATEYRWQDGSTSPTFLVTKAGSYSVTVTTPCKTLRDTIKVDYALDFDLGRDTTLCDGQTITLKTPPNVPPTFRWQDGSTTLTYPVEQGGLYSLRVQQASCVVTDSIQIRFVRPPRLNLGLDQNLCGAEVYTIRPDYAEGKFAWQDQTVEVVRTVGQTGLFRASVSNDCATVSDTIGISYSDCGCVLYTPDVFTPNGDGQNDVFQPFGCGDITIKSLSVFNRWGELIFRTDVPPFEWNGNYLGKTAPSGVYGWLIQYTLNQGTGVLAEQKRGALSLTR